VLGKARGKGTRQGAKDGYECLELGKVRWAWGRECVVMEMLLCK